MADNRSIVQDPVEATLMAAKHSLAAALDQATTEFVDRAEQAGVEFPRALSAVFMALECELCAALACLDDPARRQAVMDMLSAGALGNAELIRRERDTMPGAMVQ